jgi:hypothetical protein
MKYYLERLPPINLESHHKSYVGVVAMKTQQKTTNKQKTKQYCHIS